MANKNNRKTALITGASQGLGAAMAVKLAQDGFDIAINCRSEQGALKTKQAVEQVGVEAACFCADVSDFAACKEIALAVKEHFGTIDVLVNNAGITRDGLLARMSEENFDLVTNVNYKSVFNMIRHVSGVMIRQRCGSIINVSSVAGLYGNPGQFNYSASKAGLIGMTLTAAKELGPRNIRVNAVAPGFIKTEMTDVLDDKVKTSILDAVAMGRFGEPEEVASVVAFLASDQASYVSGQVIVIDGAMSM